MAYPLFSAAGQGLLAADPGQAHLGLVLNLFNPPPCTRGYEETQRRNGTDTAPEPRRTPSSTYCAEPPGSPINVRGSDNAPLRWRAGRRRISRAPVRRPGRRSNRPGWRRIACPAR